MAKFALDDRAMPGVRHDADSRRAWRRAPGKDGAPPWPVRQAKPAVRTERHPLRRIVIGVHDPFLTFLLRRHAPDADLIEAPDDLRGALEAAPADIVVVGADRPAPAQPLLGKAKVLIVADPTEVGAVEDHPSFVLQRPYTSASVRRALAALQSEGDPAAAHRVARVPRNAWTAAPPLVLAVTVGFAASGAGLPDHQIALAAVALVILLARLFESRISPRATAWAAFAAGALLLGTSSDPDGVFVPFVLVLVLATARDVRPGESVAAGIGLSLAVLAPLLRGLDLTAAAAASRALIFPLAALAAWRVASRPPEMIDPLTEAHALLLRLDRIARRAPAALDPRTIAAEGLDEVREVATAAAGAIVVDSAATSRVAASFGIANAGALAEALPRAMGLLAGGLPVEERDLPAEFSEAAGARAWWVTVPITRGGDPIGLLIAGFAERPGDERLVTLRALAAEMALALENAVLFARLRDLSTDQERGRIAVEIHDGIAQTLRYVQLELEYLARHCPADPATTVEELRRLERVIERTVADARSIALSLRSLVGEGLAGSLRMYLQDLQGLGGPQIAFEVVGSPHVDADVAGEIFRVAQEAVSNAIRHSRAQNIRVSLVEAGGQVHLRVDDDGIGVETTAGNGRGIGLKGMKERADRLGASLTVAKGPRTGTRVELRYRRRGKWGALGAGPHVS